MLAYMASRIALLQYFLFVSFPRSDTFTITDYTRSEMIIPLEEVSSLIQSLYMSNLGYNE